MFYVGVLLFCIALVTLLTVVSERGFDSPRSRQESRRTGVRWLCETVAHFSGATASFVIREGSRRAARVGYLCLRIMCLGRAAQKFAGCWRDESAEP